MFREFDTYLSFHKYTNTCNKKSGGELGDRFIEEIHSKIFPLLRHELQNYKRHARFITQKMCSKLSTVVFHVRKPSAELQQMGWNHHTGKLAYTRTDKCTASV